jgi:nucleoside phosphorylase
MLVVAATQHELAQIGGVDTFVCGIGPVDAAASVAARLAAGDIDAVLHVGIAGSRELPLLTVVLGSESVYSDMAAAIPVVDRVEPDAALFERVRAAMPDAVVASIGTSAAVGRGTCDVEAMEGFGVLRACALAGVPAVELRVVSNSPDESDRSKWRFAEAFGVLGHTVARLWT